MSSRHSRRNRWESRWISPRLWSTVKRVSTCDRDMGQIDWRASVCLERSRLFHHRWPTDCPGKRTIWLLPNARRNPPEVARWNWDRTSTSTWCWRDKLARNEASFFDLIFIGISPAEEFSHTLRFRSSSSSAVPSIQICLLSTQRFHSSRNPLLYCSCNQQRRSWGPSDIHARRF